MRLALLIACGVAVLTAISARPDAVFQPLLWLPLVLGYTALATFALLRLKKQDKLRALFAVRGGDISIGVVVGFALLAITWLIKTRIIPAGTGREAWLLQIQVLLGSLDGILPRAALLAWLALAEELVWRGVVAHELKAELGVRKAFPIAGALYATSLLPTVWTLADPMAGANPLLMLAALGAGLIWTALSLTQGRLIAAWVSHVVFVYFVVSPLPLLRIFP